ncbi:NADP-dependent malic enzyme [Candidatus Trichorickettsia mobilis]|uniref:NADP-dependent malic enzyme n=1 Tax=Candidatus Trichorickettsia mobilis TaxID=1346319 RepID=UPI00293121BC|nr:NADP-dependent malic enzyme [Candidatus Trichorickettsia mobilis]
MDKINKSEYEKALKYHAQDRPGKIAVVPTKPLVTQQDLSLAYTPGVAAPCLEIAKNLDNIYKYTARGNIVAVISNGTAVLGLGNLGAAASKPVMEGKAVLFKNFADIDAIDLEVDTTDPEEFINVVKYLGYSFGGINLEDIKAPECFIIEERLNNCMQIPVFHDDQHGTAIIASAGLINAAYLTNRTFAEMKIVVNGAGAAALACIELLIALGAVSQNITLCDTNGVVYQGRTEGMNKWKEKYAIETKLRTLTEAMNGADVFLGLSARGAVTKEMVAAMALNPIIFALANPEPEISPESIKAVRSDAIIATGRSDYNNQVNNVMGFPYIFRGALDVRATTINQEMKIAASQALAELARSPVPDEVYKAYPDRKMCFGSEYIIPVPFDPRLISTIPVAVAVAAIASGATKITNLDCKAYKAELMSRLNPTSSYMNFLFEKIHKHPKRIVFAEGEEEEVIKAAMMMRDDALGYPILVGRSHKITPMINNMGVEHNLEGIAIMNAAINPNLKKYIDALYSKLQRKGFLYRDCARLVKTDRNVFAACMVASGDADAVVTGLNKSYFNNFEDIAKVIQPKVGNRILSYSIMLAKEHQVLIADNAVNELPSSQELVELAIQMAGIAKNMGYYPRVALLSFSNFGNPMREEASRIQEAVKILDNMKVDFEYDGEMSADIALNPELHKIYPFCRLSGSANVLIMPDLHSAAIATQLLQELGAGVFIGPILNGFEYSVQIVPMGSSASQILKIAAFAAIEVINDG